MLEDLGEFMVFGDQNMGKRLVVAQQDIVARLQPLDQVGFEKQRLDLRRGDDELHGSRLGDHAKQTRRLPACLAIGRHPFP